MSWLRLDDLFLENRKIAALTDRQKVIHLAALLYSCRHNTHGVLTPSVALRLGAKSRDIERFVVLHLWEPQDEEQDGYEINDFEVYNGETIEDRVRAYVEKKPDASANEIVRAVGGKRNIVLAVIKEMKDAA